MAGRTGCFSRAGAASSLSIRHLPTVARRPLAASVSSTTSVPCTVSIVSTQVVPVRSSSCTASRVLTRSDASSCAASIGHTRWRSQASSAQIVGGTAEERLAEVDMRLHEARQHEAAADVDRRQVLGLRAADLHDDAVTHDDRSLDHVEGIVHREDGRAAQDAGRHARVTARTPDA